MGYTYLHGVDSIDSSDCDGCDGTINSIIGSSPGVIVCLTLQQGVAIHSCKMCVRADCHAYMMVMCELYCSISLPCASHVNMQQQKWLNYLYDPVWIGTKYSDDGGRCVIHCRQGCIR